jgi:transcriptional regulator with PAS, ATPase and Fis domain
MSEQPATSSLAAPPRDRAGGEVSLDALFDSLGRTLLTLGADFRVRGVSGAAFLGAGPLAGESLLGAPAHELFGAELFGPSGALRLALLAGERRESSRAHLRIGAVAASDVSVIAAPLGEGARAGCDPAVRYLLVVRPLGEEHAVHGLGIIARSRQMAGVVALIESIAESDATVLITGESGTGKEVVARAIHERSARRAGPMVAVNCGAIPSELLESELFGHVRGAFSGAVRDRVGRFEAAEHGTLFLDEIGDLAPHLQVKLLRVLQEHTYERVGETQERRTDARILAATNADLERAVELGRFREDLYYRLRVVPIELAPLQARPEDIEPLARHLLARAMARSGRLLQLSPEAMKVLLLHRWPGNVRELENAMEYAAAVCKLEVIQPEDLPPGVRGRGPAAPGAERTARGLNHLGLAAVRTVLDQHQWNRASAAQALGVSRTTLWRRMRELRLVR